MADLLALWRAYLRRIAIRQSEVLLTLLYLTVVVPTALVARLAGHRFLPDAEGLPPTRWWTRRPATPGLDELRRSY